MNAHLPFCRYVGELRSRGLLRGESATHGAQNTQIGYITYDSRRVRPGTLFICKGAGFKETYLADAKNSGAVAYVSETKYENVDLPALTVSDVREATVVLGQMFYGHVTDRLTTVGITGTKGKSTTAYYLRAILDAQFAAEGRRPAAIMSSIHTFDGVSETESDLTTPEPLELYAHFQNAFDSGLTHMIMEVSSQALKYGRVQGMSFDVACFLNIGEDHISPVEHPDFADYFASKLKIFSLAKIACINADSDRFAQIAQAAEKAGADVVTFGKNGADVRISNIRVLSGEIVFRVDSRSFRGDFSITMPGVFNVENAAAAIAVAQCLNVPEQYVREGLRKARAEGRMQIYKSADGLVTGVVDFAHNKMSFRAVFDTMKQMNPQAQIVAVFGSAGGKAISRRKDLGQTAGEYADFVILTEDDPGSEPVADICADIARYVSCPHMTVPARDEAIGKAILGEYPHSGNALPRVVLCLGKGHESTMKYARGPEVFPSDSVLVQRFLAQYNALHA